MSSKAKSISWDSPFKLDVWKVPSGEYTYPHTISAKSRMEKGKLLKESGGICLEGTLFPRLSSGRIKVLNSWKEANNLKGCRSRDFFFCFSKYFLEASHYQRYTSVRYLSSFCITLQRKFHLYIYFLGIARPQSQCPHSCVCERFLYSQHRCTYFLQQIKRGNI